MGSFGGDWRGWFFESGEEMWRGLPGNRVSFWDERAVAIGACEGVERVSGFN